MHDTVLKFGKLGIVPTVSCADKIACDALKAVDIVAVAVRTLFKVFLRILISAVHTTVAVVVHGAVADVVLVHEVDNIGDCLGIVGRITVNFHIEDMSATGQGMIRSLDLCLVAG